jgi:FkbM family methyltransferase
MTFISYAQNYEDVILWRALKHIEKGFYIDVGANDPVLDSVTRAFYDRGWRGINIEPVTAWFQKLQRERPEDINLQVAASNTSGELLFFEVVDTGLSTTNSNFAAQHAKDRGYRLEEYNVPAKTITNICREENFLEIHFLKVDVEGSETVVLEGIDFRIIRPWIVLVEATLPNTQVEDYKSWESLIIDSNYHFVYFDGLNRFYVADEHRELDTAFQRPPNYWDDFIKNKEYEVSQQCQNLKGQCQQLQGEYQQLQGDYQQLQRKYQTLQGEHQYLQRKYQTLQGEHQSVSRELYDIKHGRLWYMTAPLRRVGDLERLFKQRFGHRILKRNRLNDPKVNLTFRSPSKEEDNDPNSTSMLTPRAARILRDLKRTTEKR